MQQTFSSFTSGVHYLLSPRIALGDLYRIFHCNSFTKISQYKYDEGKVVINTRSSMEKMVMPQIMEKDCEKCLSQPKSTGYSRFQLCLSVPTKFIE